MESLLSAENLQLFLAFVVPGIVVVYFRTQFLTGKMPLFSEGLATYVTISLVYHAAALGLLEGTRSETLFGKLRNWQWCLWVFLVPAIIGIFSGLNGRHGWTSNIFSKFRANTVHPIGCAWDWKFSNCQEAWVRVQLKDGKEWGGVLGTHSFLSSNPAERDLYLEKVYFLEQDNSWTEKSSSVWIGHSEIQSIEMWPKT